MRRKIVHVFFLLPLFAFAIHSYGQCPINCPGNITVPNAPGVCGANVSYSVTAGGCQLQEVFSRWEQQLYKLRQPMENPRKKTGRGTTIISPHDNSST